jgi:porin
LIFNGPLSFRPKDGLSFGFVYSKVGSAYNNDVKAGIFAPAAVGLNDEKAFEANYKAQITPWLVLQPVYQHYSNVGLHKVGSASLAGFRFQATF